MKKLLFLLLMILSGTGAWCQADASDATHGPDPKAMEKIRAARVAYITERLKLTPEEAEKFWPIYTEFADKRTQLRQEFEQARKTQDPSANDEESQRKLIDLGLKLKQQELDLEKEYSSRLLQTISAQKLMNLKPAEEDFRNLILRQIQQRQLQEDRKDLMRDKVEQQRRDMNN